MTIRYALFAVLSAGLALPALDAEAARLATLATIASGSPMNFGVVAAVDEIREDRPLHQLRVKLNGGEWRTIVQDRLNDVRVGDRVTIDDGQVFRHDTWAERIDRWGYWVDAKGNRYDDIGLRVEEGTSDGN